MPVGDGPQIVGGNGITRFIFPRPGAPSFPKDDNRDRHSFGVVYANDLALEDMSGKLPLNFRSGAIIVREKLSKPDSTTPELLAVMIKRGKGFNPRANDWEFLVANGKGTKVRHREKTGECLGCHQSQKERDLVYKEYVRQ